LLAASPEGVTIGNVMQAAMATAWPLPSPLRYELACPAGRSQERQATGPKSRQWKSRPVTSGMAFVDQCRRGFQPGLAVTLRWRRRMSVPGWSRWPAQVPLAGCLRARFRIAGSVHGTRLRGHWALKDRLFGGANRIDHACCRLNQSAGWRKQKNRIVSRAREIFKYIQPAPVRRRSPKRFDTVLKVD
jgi:hypothetical protein